MSLPGWEANNSVAILFRHNHTDIAGARWVESFSPTREGVNTPALELTWTEPPKYSQTFSVTSRLDSGEEQLSTGMMYLDSSDLELCTDGTSDQLVGLSFRGVALTAADAASLSNTRIWFDVDEVRA